MILLNGYQAYTNSKEGVKYNLVNPHLVYDSIPSSAAEIPTFPAEGANRAIFGYWEEPQSGGRIPSLEYQHFEDGNLIREGFFLLTEASEEEGYKGTFSDRLGEFFGEYQHQSLRLLPLGTVTRATNPFPWAMTGGQIQLCYPLIQNETCYESNSSYNSSMNAFSGTTASYTYDPSMPLVPMFGVNYIMSRIAQLAGVTIDGPWFTDPEWKNLILFNTRESETTTINIADHLPQMSVVEFFLELRKTANLRFDFNSLERKLTISLWEDALKADSRIDWSEKAVAGQNKTQELNTRLAITQQVDPADAIVPTNASLIGLFTPAWLNRNRDYLSPVVPDSGNGIVTIASKFGTLMRSESQHYAICRQPVKSSKFGQMEKEWTPRLLFWRGMMYSDSMPVASPDSTTLSLRPEALAQSSYAHTLSLRQRMFYLKKELILTEADIASLDWGAKYHINGVDYLLAQLEVSVPVRGTASALLIGGV